MNQNDVATFTNAITQKLYQILVDQAKQMSFDEVQSNILANQIVPPWKERIQAKLASSTVAKATIAMIEIKPRSVYYKVPPQTQKFNKLSELAKLCLEACFAKL
jgi:hypothetical protein